MQLSRRSAVGLVVMNVVALAGRGQVQQRSTPGIPAPGQAGSASGFPDGAAPNNEPPSAANERMRTTAERMHEDERRKRMLSDSDKLLALSGELKADIEKAGRDELSMVVIRKAAEIEKLARDVQNRMKG